MICCLRLVVAVLHGESGALRRNVDKLQEDIASTDTSALQAENTALRRDLDELQRQLQGNNTATSALQDKNGSLQRVVDALQRQLQDSGTTGNTKANTSMSPRLSRCWKNDARWIVHVSSQPFWSWDRWALEHVEQAEFGS